MDGSLLYPFIKKGNNMGHLPSWGAAGITLRKHSLPGFAGEPCTACAIVFFSQCCRSFVYKTNRYRRVTLNTSSIHILKDVLSKTNLFFAFQLQLLNLGRIVINWNKYRIFHLSPEHSPPYLSEKLSSHLLY